MLLKLCQILVFQNESIQNEYILLLWNEGYLRTSTTTRNPGKKFFTSPNSMVSCLRKKIGFLLFHYANRTTFHLQNVGYEFFIWEDMVLMNLEDRRIVGREIGMRGRYKLFWLTLITCLKQWNLNKLDYYNSRRLLYLLFLNIFSLN